jgi:hypothetical protein
VPSNFRVTATDTTSIAVAWNASTDTETGLAGYDVSIDSGAYVSLGNVLVYTFSGLSAGTSHTLRVRSRDAANNVSAAAQLTASTASPVVVGAPANFRVTATANTSISLAWDPPSSLPTGVTVARYETQQGTAAFTSNSTAATRQYTGLTADTSYTFGVHAILSDGTTTPTATLAARTSGTVPVVATRFGMRVQNPDQSSAASTYAPYADLDYLRASTNQTTLQNINDDLYKSYAAVTGTGAFFDITTEYARTIGSSVLSSYGSAMVTKYGAHCISLIASDWAGYAADSPSATILNNIQSMCNALPSGAPIYLIFVNEPDRDVDATHTPALYRKAVARFAYEVKQRRGTKLLYPATAYTKLSIVNQQNQVVSTATDWNCAPEMLALGLDPATDIVMAQHGYAQDPADPTDQWSAMFNPVYDLYRSWGFRRMGFSEGASKNRTSAHFTAFSTWLDDLFAGIARNQLEFFVYYNSGGSGGIAATEGWWIAGSGYQSLTNANRIKFAQKVRDYVG